MIMKAPIIGLAMVTAAFAGTSLYFWQQLETERSRSAQAEAASRQLQDRIAALEKASARVGEQRVANANGFIAGTFGSGLPPPPAPSADSAGQPGPNGEKNVWTATRHEPSPAMQKMMRTNVRAHNKRLYSDLAKQLGLGKEKTEKLVDLLTEQQLAAIGGFHQFNDGEDAQRQFEETQRANDLAISDLIGPDKAMALKEYQETIPTRMEVEVLARQMADNDAPLTEAQSKKLIELFTEERKRVPAPEPNGENAADYAKLANAWKDDYDRRVADEASRILNSTQLATYDEFQQSQKEMRDQLAASGIALPSPGYARRVMGVNNMMYSGPMFISATTAVEAPAAAPKEDKKP